jgi:uncharacterized membrane-anchored protein YhcB (DUF1043 family)
MFRITKTHPKYAQIIIVYQEMRKNLDASEKLYKKVKKNDLDYYKSFIHSYFCSTCSLVKTMCRYVHIQIHI